MSDKRVPWAEGQRALVRWAATAEHGAGDWFEAVAQMHECERVEKNTADVDICQAWVYDLDNFVPDDDADIRPLPDHCGTCFKPFGCGCPGDGWVVPVHVKLPEVVEGITLYGWDGYGTLEWQWVCGDASDWLGSYGKRGVTGCECRPCIPFMDGRPIYLKPWGQP